MTTPTLSVVMPVYNDMEGLSKSIESILRQDYQDFELLIVNDGSTDRTCDVLAAYSKNPLIRVITQTNQGITQALIHGCALARGRFIARHDTDDESAHTRFSQQLAILNEQDDCVMVSTATLFQAPDGETMYVAKLSNEEARNSLKINSAEQLKGPPHHGSVMFRKSSYESVGGYRKQFYVAQDIDLWTRIVELGTHVSLDSVLYTARFSASSISATKRTDQVCLTKKIVECSLARQKHGSDQKIIENLPEPQRGKLAKDKTQADFYHFVGSTLLSHNPRAARKYFRQALQLQFFRPKTIAKMMASLLSRDN